MRKTITQIAANQNQKAASRYARESESWHILEFQRNRMSS